MSVISNFLVELSYFFNEIAIYLLFGFSVAAILHILFPDSFVSKHFGDSSKSAVLKASLFGIPLPICSCGIIPIATSLKRKGASDGAVVSFMISTPQIGADSFMITYALIGWVFGLFRIAAAFFSAIFAGFSVNIFSKNERKDKKIFNFDKVKIEKENYISRIKHIISYIQFEVFGSIADNLLVGIIIAAAISIFVPASIFETYMSNNFVSMLIMLVVGIPMYICATSSTPIAASLILKGISPGAALVFLLVGPATNAMTISAVAKTMGKRTVAIYLASLSIISVTLGYLLNFISVNFNIDLISEQKMEMLPTWLKLLGSTIILLMFLIYYFTKYKRKILKIFRKENKEKIIIDVKGMTCPHCSGSVRKAVERHSELKNIEVDLDAGKVLFDTDNYDEKLKEKIEKSIIEAGFEIDNKSELITLSVLGMTCPHCAASTKKAVLAVAGNSNVVVDLDAKEVKYNGVRSEIEKVKKSIIEAGFSVE